MARRTNGTTAALGVAIGLGGAAAHAGINLCPPSLKTRQTAAVPPGFAAVRAAAAAPLLAFTFFDKDLGAGAALEPDEIRRFEDGTLVSTWTFLQGRWHPSLVRCSYWGTQVALERAVDAKISSCAVTYDGTRRIGGAPLILNIDCK
ncbi:MAG: STY0301 family protein [Alphaproteobacteria bacterium]